MKSDPEFRIDIRGKHGKVTRVRVLSRENGAKFRPDTGEWSVEHVKHYRKFAKVMAAIARGAVPPLDIDRVCATRRDTRIKTPPAKSERSRHDQGGMTD